MPSTLHLKKLQANKFQQLQKISASTVDQGRYIKVFRKKKKIKKLLWYRKQSTLLESAHQRCWCSTKMQSDNCLADNGAYINTRGLSARHPPAQPAVLLYMQITVVIRNSGGISNFKNFDEAFAFVGYTDFWCLWYAYACPAEEFRHLERSKWVAKSTRIIIKHVCVASRICMMIVSWLDYSENLL